MTIHDMMLTQYFDKMLAQATSAGYVFYPNLENRAIALVFKGFSEKIETLIELVVSNLMTAFETMDETLFESQKKLLKKRYFNNSLNAGSLSTSLYTKILSNDEFTDFDLLSVIDGISFENLQRFVSKFFKKLKIQVLVEGNLRRIQAMNILSILKANIECDPLDEDVEKQRCYEVPIGSSILRVKTMSLKDGNSYITNLYQFGSGTLRTRSIAFIIRSILHTKAFDYLRTKEQLGYNVGLSIHDKHGVIGLRLYVQSPEAKNSFAKVAEKMETFMDEIAKPAIEELTDEDFEDFKVSRVKDMSNELKSLYEAFGRDWTEIEKKEYVFDRYELSAKAAQTITKTEIQQFLRTITAPETMRKMSIQVIGSREAQMDIDEGFGNRELTLQFLSETVNDSENVVGNIKDFRSNLMLHPVVKFKIE